MKINFALGTAKDLAMDVFWVVAPCILVSGKLRHRSENLKSNLANLYGESTQRFEW
jgi:hypothetical protein